MWSPAFIILTPPPPPLDDTDSYCPDAQMTGYLFVVLRMSWPEQARLAVQRCAREETVVQAAAEEPGVNLQATEERGELIVADATEDTPLVSQSLGVTRRSIIISRAIIVGAFALLLLVSIIVRYILHAPALTLSILIQPPAFCYPAPTALHASTCTSAAAGHFCSVSTAFNYCYRALPYPTGGHTLESLWRTGRL
jgi:hypothetical protein